MTREEAMALLERYSNYDGMGIPNLAGCKEAMKVAVESLKEAFPELAESEDERIRKEMIAFLKSEKAFQTIDLPISERWLAYLEKQKENPKSADSIPSDCVSSAKCEDRWHKVDDSLPDNPREVLCKDEAGNYFIGRYYVGEGWEISNYDDEDKPHHLNPPVSKWIDFPPEKQKEQDWNKKPCLTCQEYEKGHKQGYTEGCTAGYNKAMKEVDEQKEQKPADLPAGFYVTLDGKKYYTKEIRCKGMNVKVVEPKPAEWSEEDEDYMNAIITIINRETALYPNGGATEELNNDLITWLKSLRPSWKPSEGR